LDQYEKGAHEVSTRQRAKGRDLTIADDQGAGKGVTSAKKKNPLP